MKNLKNQIMNKNNSVFIVAEAGINHNSDMKIAKQMIESASKCGADAIKFQTIIPDELFSAKLNPELYEMSKDWVLSTKQHRELKNHAKKHNIEFFSTPFGTKSVKILKDVGIKIIKIASGDMNNFQLIQEASNLKIPLIISTGMSTFSEISSTVEFVKSLKREFILLHCNSSYPTPLRDVNLSTIPFLRKTFDIPIGYSDHTLGIESCLGAVSLGACTIEKHFTLDKNMPGPDQKLSSDPEEFSNLVKSIRKIEKTIGTPRSNFTASEKNFRKSMRKSVGVTRNIKKGEILKKNDLAVFRPGTGIPPNMLNNLVGMKVQKSIKKGSVLNWKCF